MTYEQLADNYWANVVGLLHSEHAYPLPAAAESARRYRGLLLAVGAEAVVYNTPESVTAKSVIANFPANVAVSA